MGLQTEEDAYVHYIQLWYYFSRYFKGTGTLYDLSKNRLEADIEEKVKRNYEQL